MNAGVYICSGGVVFFSAMALVFGLLKGKAAVLISGFNTMPAAKRELYDQDKMSADMRNSLLSWVLIMAAGAVFSFLISAYMAIPAFGVWLVLLFKEVHLDAEKAFGKYRIK